MISDLFLYLYPFVGGIFIAAYIPQILALVRNHELARNFVITPWACWAVAYGISIGYGFVHLNDIWFIVVQMVHMVSICCIIGLVLYKKHLKYMRLEMPTQLQHARIYILPAMILPVSVYLG